jgi:hypothetical protein
VSNPLNNIQKRDHQPKISKMEVNNLKKQTAFERPTA